MIAIRQEMYKDVRRRFRLRSLEWERACMSIAWGVVVLLNPAIFSQPSFAAFFGGPYVWGAVVLGVGIANVIALVINGTVPRPTALARTIAAGLNILLFTILTLGFLFSGTGTTGLAIYGVIAVFSFPAMAWALLDVVVPAYHDE